MAACKGVNIPSGVIVLARLNCSFMMLTAGRPSLHGMCSEGMLLGFFGGVACQWVHVCAGVHVERLTPRCLPLPPLTDPGAH